MTVVVAYAHGAEQSSVFAESLRLLLDHTPDTIPLSWFGVTGGIHRTRNGMVKTFLDQSDHEWLWMVDSDMAFAPDTVDMFLSVADPQEFPVVGGLCFGQRTSGRDELNIPLFEQYPTIYKLNPDTMSFGAVDEYPDNAFMRCAGTGGACLFIHRTVLEAMREQVGDHWFTPVAGAGGDPQEPFSEDLSFCVRLGQLGVPLHVHTGIRTGHQKPAFLTHESFMAQGTLPVQRGERWVVIPTKNNFGQLRDLIGQLRSQGEADGIVIVDNGVNRTGRNWLSSQKYLTVIEMPGAGIHHMWNAGADLVPDGADVAFLNDDLRIGERFLSGLQDGLTGNRVVTSPNYDQRTHETVTTNIAANRYDGTGGISGFAFMVSGQFLRSYRFPEDCMWWFGDNDLMLTVAQAGKTGVVLTSPTVEHLDGGGQTGDWEAAEFKKQTDADEVAFMAKWGAVKVPA